MVQGTRFKENRKPCTLYPFPGMEGGAAMDGYKGLLYGLAIFGVLLVWVAFSPLPATAQMTHRW